MREIRRRDHVIGPTIRVADQAAPYRWHSLVEGLHPITTLSALSRTGNLRSTSPQPSYATWAISLPAKYLQYKSFL
jgi:hypothetical protein